MQAPTFTPTWAEFKNPLRYIASISEEGSRYGICRIRPPLGWRPPFAVNVDDDTCVSRRVRRAGGSLHGRQGACACIAALSLDGGMAVCRSVAPVCAVRFARFAGTPSARECSP